MATNPYAWMAPQASTGQIGPNGQPVGRAPMDPGAGGFVGPAGINPNASLSGIQRPTGDMGMRGANMNNPSAGGQGIGGVQTFGGPSARTAGAPPVFNPEYAYGMPGTQFNPNISPQGMPGMEEYFNRYGPNSGLDYMDENVRNMAEGYTNYFQTPYFNAMMADRTQSFNEQQFGATFNEQQRINNLRYSLDRAAAQREDEALRFGQQTNQRDFGETQRQFDATTGLQRDTLNAQTAMERERARIAQYEAQTGRMDIEGRQRLDQFANQTARMGVQNQFTLGQGQQDIDRTRVGNEFTLGRESNANTRLGIQNQFTLGQGQLANDRFANDTSRLGVQNQFTLGQGQLSNDRYSNETSRMGVQNQFTLGQGQLGFQNRELDVNDAFRREEMTQNAALSREKMGNDLTQSRYSAFGRAQQPNFQAVGGFR